MVVPMQRTGDGKAGNSHSAVASEVAELDAIVALVVRGAPFITQAEVQGEFGRDLPIILEIKAGLFRFIRHRWINVDDAAVIGISEEQAGEGIALGPVGRAAVGDLRGHIVSEVEKSGGVRRLEEVVIEQALLTAKFEDVIAMNNFEI